MRDSLLQLADAFPRRRPGSSGDAALADRVGQVLRAAGFGVETTREPGRTVDGEVELETVVGVRPGLSSRRIVVLAHRDSLDEPGLADLSGTAALLELARIFRTKVPSTEAETRRARPAAARGARPAQDARPGLDLGRERRRGRRAGVGARAGRRADRRRARARRPGVRGVAQAVGRAVVERPVAAADRLAADRRGGGAPGGRRRSRRLARERAVVAPRGAADGVGAGRGQSRGRARRAAADQRRARAGAGRAGLAASGSPSWGARRCGPSPRSTRRAGARPAARRCRRSRASRTGS